MKKFITEFIGTFFLVLVVGLAGGMGDMAPLAIGSVLMVVIYAGGHISGAHYNPAVTLSVMFRGRIGLNDGVMYMICQFAGAAAASLVAAKVFDAGGDGSSAVSGGVDIVKGLTGEILGTFALAYVVLNVATAKANSGNSHYGLAIGFTVLSMAYALGGFSGGAFNPAVALGQSIGGHFAWNEIWIYLLGCSAGGSLAAIIFKMNNPDDK
jgi:aquaporin Z